MLRIDATTLCGLAGRLPLVGLCHVAGWNVTGRKAPAYKQANVTAAIQAEIDKCAGAGGVARVPPGNHRCGQLRLRSNVTLHLEAGATLWVSPEKADYKQGRRFPFAEGESNITIEGRRTTRGTGENVEKYVVSTIDKAGAVRAFW